MASSGFPSRRCLEALMYKDDFPDRAKLPCEPILFRFPAELLLEIFSYLTLPEQICLSLTCKGMLDVLGDVVHDGRVQFPPGNQNEGPPQANPQDSSYTSHRVSLLVHLVDDQWSYCGHCRMLHPREQMFQPGFVRRPVYDRLGLRTVTSTAHCPFTPTLFFDGMNAWRPVLGRFEAIASRVTDRRHIRALKITSSDPRPRLTNGLAKFYFYKGTALGARVKLRVVVLVYGDGMCVSHARYKIALGTSESKYSFMMLCPHFNLSRLSHPCILHCMRCHLSVQMELAPDGTRIVYTWQIGC